MRTNNSVRNITAALIGQCVGIILSFIERIVFIRTLGTQYLGINGLFSNILSLLSLAELGVGAAIIYSLYKPLAMQDTYKVQALMRYYGRAYKVIGMAIGVMGVGLVPFLPVMVKEQLHISNLTFLYLLFLSNTVCSYFFAYKRSLIIADQKSYITTLLRYTFYALLNIVQIIILLIIHSYSLFLIAQIAATMLENICITYKADKMYPYLKSKEKAKLDDKTRQEIRKSIRAMMCHRLGGVVVNGTDNIIISSFIGINWVGLYSNYYLIISALSIIIGQIFNAVTASVGNLNALESKERSYSIYRYILFANFWLAGVTSTMLWILFNPFIRLWLGKEYLLDQSVVLIMIINFYMVLVRKTTLVFRDSFGLFWYDRYKPLFESVINIIVSILLAMKLGIGGVFIGTFVSSITTSFWVEPYVLFKYGFKKDVKEYFVLLVKYTALAVISIGITSLIGRGMPDKQRYSLMIKGMVAFGISNGVYIVFSLRNEGLYYFLHIAKGIIARVFNKCNLESVLKK